MPMLEGLVEDGFQSFAFLPVTSADRAGHIDKTEEMETMRRFEKKFTVKRPCNLTLVTHCIEKREDFLPPAAEGGTPRSVPWLSIS
jgi:hypothetical protein